AEPAVAAVDDAAANDGASFTLFTTSENVCDAATPTPSLVRIVIEVPAAFTSASCGVPVRRHEREPVLPTSASDTHDGCPPENEHESVCDTFDRSTSLSTNAMSL